MGELFDLYESGMSIPQVSEALSIPRSTVRFKLLRAGKLRSRADGVRLAAKAGRMSFGKGMARIFTEEWRDNISKAKTGVGAGFSVKANGYVEITMGENKGRMEHCVIIERMVGRRMFANECVHHIDGNRANNSESNLKLMTRSEHAKYHAKTNHKTRGRDSNGRFNNECKPRNINR